MNKRNENNKIVAVRVALTMLKRIVAITAAAAVTSQPLAPSCSCAAGACNLTSTVEFSGCVEYSGARARTNQNCTAICASWRNAPPPTQGNLPGARISTQSTKWWSCKVPGALMLSTGNNTHCTIAYFNKAKADSSVRASSQQDIIALAMAFAKGHDGMSELDVRGSLTHMWGCGAAGGSCHPSSVLVDVASPLAQLKYGVMDALLAQGYAVDTTSWGATAHIDLASSKSATSATAAVHSASSAMTALPPRQSPSQAALFDRVSRDAKSDSASATATILAYLDTAPFRAALAECCGSVAALPATTLLARFRAEVDTMELVHNFDPRGGEFGELNLTQWLRMDYDYNLWTMAYLGNHTPSFLSNCDKAETGLMGFRPFSNVRRGSGDLPHTLAEAWERPIYTALNLWHASTGNQKFGPISIVFNRTVADELTLLLPVDSGLWEGSCNRTEEEVATPLSYNRMNCSAWQRGTPGDDPSADLHLGTFAAYDHVAATWLTSQGIWQPAYRAPIPPRLFARLFAGFITNSSAPGTGFLPNGATNLTTQEVRIVESVGLRSRMRLISHRVSPPSSSAFSGRHWTTLLGSANRRRHTLPSAWLRREDARRTVRPALRGPDRWTTAPSACAAERLDFALGAWSARSIEQQLAPPLAACTDEQRDVVNGGTCCGSDDAQ